MQNPTSLKELIQQLIPRPPEIIIGRVVSENPLEIRAENDEKLSLTGCNIIVPKRLSLHKNDYVHILVLSGGKTYYALDRRD